MSTKQDLSRYTREGLEQELQDLALAKEGLSRLGIEEAEVSKGVKAIERKEKAVRAALKELSGEGDDGG